jgi:AcrR family transcriptional regulator
MDLRGGRRATKDGGVEEGGNPRVRGVLSPGSIHHIRRMPPNIKRENGARATMGLETAKRSRKPRADSILNRERLLEAATEIFAAGGPQASLEAVARRAEVGIGTLYRHFPTREALFEAVYRHEVDQLGDLADRLTREADPVEALRAWLHAQVGLVATKKGMIEGLQLAAHGSSELKAYSFERLTRALSALLERGVAAHEIRSDVSADDVLRALVGMIYAQGGRDWQAAALRLVDVFVDGLRARKGIVTSSK